MSKIQSSDIFLLFLDNSWIHALVFVTQSSLYPQESRDLSFVVLLKKKSRIRETKYLLTDADSSTDAIGRWTKNTTKPNSFEKRKKSSKTQKPKSV